MHVLLVIAYQCVRLSVQAVSGIPSGVTHRQAEFATLSVLSIPDPDQLATST